MPPIIARYAKMQGTVEKAKRARIVPALAATLSDIPRASARFAAYANNTGTKKPIVPTSFAAYADNKGTKKRASLSSSVTRLETTVSHFCR